MTASGNWMDEANRLAKLWSEQQQNFLAMMTGKSATPGATVGEWPAMDAPAGMQQAQQLWHASIEKWMALAPQGFAPSSATNDML